MEKFIKYDIKIETQKETQNYAKMVISPLERGFGNTLGNALRRVCLSSIPGVAVFAIKIPSITHEFQAIEGVYEDVTQIILNLKQLVVSIDEKIVPYDELLNTSIEKWQTLKIKTNKPGELTANNIECPVGFKVINRDLHIATITKEVNFEMEIYVKPGRGFKTFKDNKEGISTLSIITTDSDFNPITKFNYYVEEIKNNKYMTNDQLTIEIATNGAISAGSAIAMSSKILVEHFSLLTNLDEQIRELEIMKEKDAETRKLNLSISIDDLNLSVRAYNALKQMNINTAQELIEKTRKEIDGIRNLGKKSVQEIIKAVHDHGLKLKDE